MYSCWLSVVNNPHAQEYFYYPMFLLEKNSRWKHFAPLELILFRDIPEPLM